MNKQEAIEQINHIDTLHINDKTICQQVDIVVKNQVLDIINQIDEPQKPKVPQFVANWYEEHKNYFEYNLQSLCVDFHERKLQKDLHEWFNYLSKKPIETIVMMHKFGYEVVKDKLYTVEIPNPNGGEYSRVYLGKYSSGKVGLYSWTDSTSIKFDNNWKQEEKAQLTEAEIKEDFAWAWKWAKEVKE